MLDALAPVIPELLEAPKEQASLSELAGKYFAIRRMAGKHQLSLFTRAEGSSRWRELRAADESLLTPDEAAILRFLLRGAGGSVDVITDYPTEESRVNQIGRRVYYSSRIDVSEFSSNLRTIESSVGRGAYLPKSGILSPQRFRVPTRSALRGIIEELGEWCYFSPASLH